MTAQPKPPARRRTAASTSGRFGAFWKEKRSLFLSEEAPILRLGRIAGAKPLSPIDILLVPEP
jgi:hypothetical protein